METISKIEIQPQTIAKEIQLPDSDYALYQTLKELIKAIENLTRKIK
jgi:hypothetical protein